jgi:hypothetical protein
MPFERINQYCRDGDTVVVDVVIRGADTRLKESKRSLWQMLASTSDDDLVEYGSSRLDLPLDYQDCVNIINLLLIANMAPE